MRRRRARRRSGSARARARPTRRRSRGRRSAPTGPPPRPMLWRGSACSRGRRRRRPIICSACSLFFCFPFVPPLAACSFASWWRLKQGRAWCWILVAAATATATGAGRSATAAATGVRRPATIASIGAGRSATAVATGFLIKSRKLPTPPSNLGSARPARNKHRAGSRQTILGSAMAAKGMTEMEVGGDDVAVITICNPPVNSLSIDVLLSLKESYEEALQRKDVKAIVVTVMGRGAARRRKETCVRSGTSSSTNNKRQRPIRQGAESSLSFAGDRERSQQHVFVPSLLIGT
ncbi:uncharacterized protein LOC123399760 isoform X2 [Hordeum vulgare subsp. vulgare]|uniref:uncharacterized protein LOC123399760 isoform X2 n=1 Tax=Hordeum vulgare subsp. vulgare TaxID=112509 RepID=UPI001D1A547D|nr:uncharacterized protein LOC123399760 isoform X2 [Hordeum vulgare subsp. vulgare]